MRAAVCEKFGPAENVKIKDLPKPVLGDRDVLIRVHASTVDVADVRIRGLRVPRGMGLLVRIAMGFSRPKQPIFGMALAGEIEEVGKGVTLFKPGDKVFGSPVFGFGCHAEYRVMQEDGALARIPEKLSYEEASALCFGGMTVNTFFQCGKLKKGEKVLVNGASGAVGTAAVQIAKHHFGAHVTGVCSAANAELVKSLGADRVIDYRTEDFAQGAEKYDVIMDAVGNAPYSRVKHLLTGNGRVLMVIGDLWQMIGAAFNKRVITGEEEGGSKSITADSIRLLAKLAETGEFKPVIDRKFPLEEIAAAHAYVDTGHKKGNVVLTLS